MLTAPQVFDMTRLIDFFYGPTWNLNRKNIFNWKDEEKENFEKKVKSFFDREHFLKMLKEWILFYIKDDELRKTILRRHQTRAIEKIVQRCADESKKTGCKVDDKMVERAIDAFADQNKREEFYKLFGSVEFKRPKE